MIIIVIVVVVVTVTARCNFLVRPIGYELMIEIGLQYLLPLGLLL